MCETQISKFTYKFKLKIVNFKLIFVDEKFTICFNRLVMIYTLPLLYITMILRAKTSQCVILILNWGELIKDLTFLVDELLVGLKSLF